MFGVFPLMLAALQGPGQGSAIRATNEPHLTHNYSNAPYPLFQHPRVVTLSARFITPAFSAALYRYFSVSSSSSLYISSPSFILVFSFSIVSGISSPNLNHLL